MLSVLARIHWEQASVVEQLHQADATDQLRSLLLKLLLHGTMSFAGNIIHSLSC